MKFIYTTFFLLFINLFLISQESSTVLKAGDVCPSIVANTSENSIQSFNFPYANKVILLHFWSSSTPKSYKDFYKYSLIHKKYASESYKSCDGFDMLFIALQSDKISWQQDIVKFNLLAINNGICLKGFNDYYVKNFKLTETPTSFLVDEFGKIILVNPDPTTLINYLESRRDYVSDNKPVSKITGKIMVQNASVTPLMNEKVYLINNKKDTIQTTTTNESGKFTLSEENLSGLTINIHKTTQIKDDDKVLLTNDKGVIVSEFNKGDNEFEYRLLDIELSFLKPLPEANQNVALKSFIKDLYFSENLYENGGFALSDKSKIKLDALLVKLKNYPKATVEIISHSDCRGASLANKQLSLKRSVSIEKYFISKGVLKTRIKSIGKGEEEPLNRCIDDVPCTDEELNVNRRTEFRFYQNE